MLRQTGAKQKLGQRLRARRQSRADWRGGNLAAITRGRADTCLSTSARIWTAAAASPEARLSPGKERCAFAFVAERSNWLRFTERNRLDWWELQLSARGLSRGGGGDRETPPVCDGNHLYKDSTPVSATLGPTLHKDATDCQRPPRSVYQRPGMFQPRPFKGARLLPHPPALSPLRPGNPAVTPEECAHTLASTHTHTPTPTKKADR